MREMKDSKNQSLGEIPNTWKLSRVKYVSDILYGFPLDSQHFSSNGFPMIRIRDITSGEIETYYDGTFPDRYIIHYGDILLGMDGDFNLREWKNVDAVLNQRCCCIRGGKDASKKYLYYALQWSLKVKNEITYSTTVKHLLADDIGNLKIALPSIDEQQKIVSFLDSKCAEIDALCADIQSEIENLETYKRSVISEAVTKGLDKNVPMKDSGIEWIGNIPEHWELKRGKSIFEQKNDKGNNKSLVLLSPTQNYGVIPQEMYEELSGFSAVKLNEKTDYNSLKTVHKGAFVISLRSFQGGFEYSEYEGVVSPAYQVFYPTIQICDGYYKYLFKTQIFIDKMNSYTMSLRDGKNIAFADFGRTYLPIPPLKEQIDIAEYLDKLCNEIKIIVEEKNQQLEILADYKKSVIYEYVTGKKEVPSV